LPASLIAGAITHVVAIAIAIAVAIAFDIAVALVAVASSPPLLPLP
jgi:hypothetical protein